VHFFDVRAFLRGAGCLTSTPAPHLSAVNSTTRQDTMSKAPPTPEHAESPVQAHEARLQATQADLAAAESELARLRLRENDLRAAVARRFAEAARCRRERDQLVRDIASHGDTDAVLAQIQDLEDRAKRLAAETQWAQTIDEGRRLDIQEAERRIPPIQARIDQIRLEIATDQLLEREPWLQQFARSDVRSRAADLLRGESPNAPFMGNRRPGEVTPSLAEQARKRS
jgi:chromosome segregation ATPase